MKGGKCPTPGAAGGLRGSHHVEQCPPAAFPLASKRLQAAADAALGLESGHGGDISDRSA